MTQIQGLKNFSINIKDTIMNMMTLTMFMKQSDDL